MRTRPWTNDGAAASIYLDNLDRNPILQLGQLHEAKNRLSHVVHEACHKGPQTITVRGEDKVVVLSAEDYLQLTRPEGDLVSFFAESPLRGVALDLERSADTARELEL